MRVGVVCEGPTDVHAVVCFLEASLANIGISSDFVMLQPEMDRTSPVDGGWNVVLKWLERNPPNSRVKAYFSGGLFDNGLSANQCDVIVFQMDTDILSHSPFQNWIKNNLGHVVVEPRDPIDRGNEIRSIIGIVGGFSELSPVDRHRHIAAPSVESTEAWCIAAFRDQSYDPERLREMDLCREFMAALHQSEARAIQHFSQINKSPNRRLRFCRKQAVGFARLERQCHHYREVTHLSSLHSSLS